MNPIHVKIFEHLIHSDCIHLSVYSYQYILKTNQLSIFTHHKFTNTMIGLDLNSKSIRNNESMSFG